MGRRLLALLVGIDRYPHPVPRLSGCVADVDAVEELLLAARPDAELHVLRDGEAIREAVVAGWRDHLGQADADDSVLFWYSGHGSHQQSARPEGSAAGGQDQTLVFADSRLPSSRDLTDVELGALIAGVASRGSHVAVVLDCCHSGSGTRDDLDVGVVRHAPRDPRPFVGAAVPTPALQEGRHVLLAACRYDQTAKEVGVAGSRRGAFSFGLERALRESGRPLSYTDLVALAGSRVSAVTSAQTPNLEVTHDEDAGLAFLGEALGNVPVHYLVRQQAGAWCIEAGTWHGLATSSSTRAATVRLFKTHTDLVGGPPLALATVEDVGPARSRLRVSRSVLVDGEEYWGVADHLGIPSLPVSIAPEVEDRVQELVTASHLLTPAPDEVALADVRRAPQGLLVRDRRARIRQDFVVDGPETVVRYFEAMAHWHHVRTLGDTDGQPVDADVQLLAVDATGERRSIGGTSIELPYEQGEPQGFVLQVTNRSARPISLCVLALDENFGITSDIVPGGHILLQPVGMPGASFESKRIRSRLPDELWRAGVTSQCDVLKVLLTPTDFDPMPLTQPVLRPGRAPDEHERKLEVEEDALPAWTAVTIEVTARRDHPAFGVGTQRVELPDGAAIETHPAFRAQLTLSSAAVAERTADAPVLPPALLDGIEASEPFSFSASRGSEALDVLELRDLQAPESVTEQAPLVVTLAQPLEPDETLLVIGRQDGYYVPVGLSRSATELHIERVPTTTDTKSLGGAVRLLVRKFVQRWVGAPLDTVRLAIPRLENGEVQYEDAPATVAAAVGSARRIGVLVHGIIGDSRGMFLGMLADGAGGPIASSYDLLLTVDYENLDTTVDQTAEQLLDKLTEAGVSREHPVELIAHSMGGLVARYLVEQAGGADIVSQLIMLGTPNGGSPWPKVQHLAWSLLTLGLNAIGTVAWPGYVVGGLLVGVEKVDSALDDMAPGSACLAKLADSPDPQIPYTVITGNTSLIAGYTSISAAGALAALGRRTAGLTFFGYPNDLAVSIESAANLPRSRNPFAVIEEVACDHISYLSSHVGLSTLARVLGRGARDG